MHTRLQVNTALEALAILTDRADLVLIVGQHLRLLRSENEVLLRDKQELESLLLYRPDYSTDEFDMKKYYANPVTQNIRSTTDSATRPSVLKAREKKAKRLETLKAYSWEIASFLGICLMLVIFLAVAHWLTYTPGV